MNIRKLVGVAVVSFLLGGGLALAVPPAPAGRERPTPLTPRTEALRTADSLLAPVVMPASSYMVIPVVEPAHGVPSDPAKRCPQFEQAFRKYGLKPVKVFSYIAWRESRCRIKAINIVYDKHGKVVWALNKNGTFDSGLLQVNSGHAQTVRKVCKGGLERLLTIDCNLKMAKYLLDNGGLQHWSISGG